MAAAVDSVSNATASTTTPVTWAHTLGGGSNLVMVVLISGAGATRATVSSVVYDPGGTNQSLSQLAGAREDGSFTWSDIWYLKAPSGNHNITVTLNQNNECYCGAIVVKDADQTTTFNTVSAISNANDPFTITVTSGTDEVAVATVVAARNGTETLTSQAGVERWNLNCGANTSVASSASIVGSASAAFSWDQSAVMDCSSCGVSVHALVGSGSASMTADVVSYSLTGAAVGVRAAQMGRPTSDIATNNWTSSLGGSLYLAIDEATADDGDYIASPNNPTNEVMEVKFGPLQDPVSSVDHYVRYRLQAIGLNTNFAVSLVCGTTVIKTWNETVTVAQGVVGFEHVLAGGEADSITDYTDLRLRVVASP